MTNRFYSTFDDLGNFFTSLAAVIIAMLVFISYRFFEVFTLFVRHLPMSEEYMYLASALISVVFILTMLLISVNIDKVRNDLKGLGNFVGFSMTLFINVYFWEAWHGDYIFKTTISLFTAAIDTWFAHLFVIIREQRQDYLKTERLRVKTSLSEARRLAQLTCPYCSRQFENQNGLNSHVGKCPENPNRK